MKRTCTIFLVLMVLAAMALAQVTPAPAPTTSPAVRIVAPRMGEKINTTFVNVQFELINSTVAASPNYRVQLDNRDPISTTSTEHTFTGIRPGSHVVRVQVVDANETPIAGAATEVQFTVVPGPASPGASLPGSPADGSDPATLPSGGSELPLLSVIGFGVLVGGIISAMRGR